MLTSEIEVVICHNQNMAVLLNMIASILYKVCKCMEIGDKNLIFSSDLGIFLIF